MQELNIDKQEKMMDSLMTKRRYGDIIFMSAVIVLLIAVITVFTVLQDCLVEGASMNPTFMDKDRVLLNAYPVRIERGDIITFYYERDDKNIIKRVIGVPGDKLKFEYIDGGPYVQVLLDTGDGYKILDEPYTNGPMLASHSTGLNDQKIGVEIVVQPGHYFVMGDNRNNSTDSRLIDQISKDDINGKYIMTLKPGSILEFIFNPGFFGRKNED